MSSVSESPARQPNGVHTDEPAIEEPSTPQDIDAAVPASSQITLPSTEPPASPIDDGNESFKTELNDDRPNGSAVIPSSLTPPPSSQVPSHNGNGVLHQPGFISSQRTALFSPPATTLNTLRRDAALSSEYSPPTARQVLEASADELRGMMQNCIAEHAKLKMETAHHKLQYNLLSLQADEDAKRAAVEYEMTRREIEALRMAEHSRQARRELSAASESAQTKYVQVKMWYEAAVEENGILNKRVKLAKKVIHQKEEEIMSLTDERDMLLNRIRENREHFHMLCSPGGIFHGALTPKQQTVSTPQQQRATPQQTPRSAARDTKLKRDHGQERLDALLQALSQDNNSAPSTPTTSNRPAPRTTSKHTRNVQSLSSLPTTPTTRPRGEHAGLLPSVDLVPQTEPVRRFTSHRFGRADRHERGRKSRESTISAEDNEELARQALESVAAAAHSASFLSQVSRGSRGSHRTGAGEEEEEVFESQASQAASEMLRKDPRESFEVASSVGSRDGTPAPAEKTAKLQAKLFSSVKIGAEKRKFSGGAATVDDARREHLASPTKKMRVGAALGENPNRVGLGILQTQ